MKVEGGTRPFPRRSSMGMICNPLVLLCALGELSAIPVRTINLREPHFPFVTFVLFVVNLPLLFFL